MSEQCWLKSICSGADCDKGFCERLYRENKLFDNALLTAAQRERIKLKLDENMADKSAFDTLSTLERSITNAVDDGYNLYLWSLITGNGKTSWMLRLIQTYIHNTWYRTTKDCNVLFISVPRYLLAIKDNISNTNTYAEHIKKYVNSADLVIWDDIGTKAATQFEHENLLSIIDSRIANGKSNFYTSNLTPADLHNSVGDRLFSRVVGYSDVIQLVGNDKRGL